MKKTTCSGSFPGDGSSSMGAVGCFAPKAKSSTSCTAAAPRRRMDPALNSASAGSNIIRLAFCGLMGTQVVDGVATQGP